MRKLYFIAAAITFIAFSTSFAGCKKDSESTGMMSTRTITDVAASNPDLSLLVQALKKTGLDAALSDGAGTFTVFAPTNAAFNALLSELKVSSLNDIPTTTLSNVLLYHVLGNRAPASMVQSGYYSTLANGPVEGSHLSLYVNMASAMLNNRSKITKTDIMADNGVIHVVDKVLLPMSIVDHAVANPAFSSLVAAVTKANLVSALSDNTKKYTVFAPTNDAFSALLSKLNTSLNDLSASTLTPILLYHVVNAYVPAASVSAGYVPTLATSFNKNVSLQIATTNGVMLNNASKVIATDVVATNGIIHVIDQVLLPPTIVDLAIQNGNFSTLVLAVVKADLVGALSGTGPFTLFAPTNDAFAALFASLKVSGISDLSKEALTPILLSHVVSGNIQSSDLKAGSVSTLNSSKSLNIVMSSSTVTINGSVSVVKPDIQGTNGVIHVIDKVILP